jgi:hypothetical protein
MKLCDPHWKELKAAIDAYGMGASIAEHSRHLGAKLKEELEGKPRTRANYDPLMGATMMIYGHSIEHGGLGIMAVEPEPCPICYFSKNCPHGPRCDVGKWIEYAARDSHEEWSKLPEA